MTKKKKKYIVVNPLGHPRFRESGEPIHIFKQGDRKWFEGDVYDGDAPENPLERGFIVEAD